LPFTFCPFPSLPFPFYPCLIPPVPALSCVSLPSPASPCLSLLFPTYLGPSLSFPASSCFSLSIHALPYLSLPLPAYLYFPVFPCLLGGCAPIGWVCTETHCRGLMCTLCWALSTTSGNTQGLTQPLRCPSFRTLVLLLTWIPAYCLYGTTNISSTWIIEVNLLTLICVELIVVVCLTFSDFL
jgi:hypothetical protein